jgi:hypothetical protein
MATKQQEKQATDSEKQGRIQLSATIGKNVLSTLGQPTDLFRVQVRSLWSSYFRVNVLLGKDQPSVRIAHSYFLSADAVGNILFSNPEITKRY